MGFPDESEIDSFVNNEYAKDFINKLVKKPKQNIKNVVFTKNVKALDLLQKMLEINPEKRITAKQALEHPYFADIRDKNDEKVFQG